MINMKDLIKKQTNMIRKQSGMKINEAFSGDDLSRMSGEIFDAVAQLNREVKRHPQGKKNSKVKKMINQLYKIEADLNDELKELE